MIEIQNVKKVYKTKESEECVALDGVTFDMPDRGMVFITGKSGSGKSTLLNMLSGLDKMTSGEIIAEGNKLSDFTESDYDNYRNKYLGFVFQDYCLMDSLTIYKNVEMALSLQSIKNPDMVLKMLEKVGLKGYENRYPKELSGGQKQSVAIARALVKEPKFILADEPTGNLDSKASEQILDLFKELSKDNLVVIVSHNTDDAEKYADQIVRLQDGKVIENIVKNQEYNNEFRIDEHDVYLPDRKLQVEELENLNESVKDGEYIFHTTKEKFIPTPKPKSHKKTVPFIKSKMPFSYVSKLSFDFLGKKKMNLIVTIIMVSLILSLLGVSQMVSKFNNNSIIRETLSKSEENVLVMQKAYEKNDAYALETDMQCAITEDEINYFISNGYSGNIYKLYNKSLPIKGEYSSNDISINIDNADRYSYLYAIDGIGVLKCSQKYLNDVFGKNGQLQLVAGKTTTNDTKIIVTDYFADSLLFHNKDLVNENENEPYAKLLQGKIKNRYEISAIINTGYREKYSKLISDFQNYSKNKSTAKELKKLLTSEEYLDFIEKLNKYYNVAYTLNANYENEVLSNTDFFVNFGRISYENEEKVEIETKMDYHFFVTDESVELMLEKNEISIPIKAYNELFNQNYTKLNFEEAPVVEVQLTHYNKDYENINTPSVYTKNLKVKIHNLEEKSEIWVMDKEMLSELAPYSLFSTALYFDNTSNAIDVYDIGKEHEFVINSNAFLAINKLSGVISVFSGYFKIFAGILFFAIAILLLHYGVSAVRNNAYEIGVVRALGCKNSNVGWAFFLQILFVGLMISIVSSIALLLLVYVLNGVLVLSFVNSYHLIGLKGIQILKFVPKVYFINLGVMLLITLIATLIPVITLKKIKPLKIIKSQE